MTGFLHHQRTGQIAPSPVSSHKAVRYVKIPDVFVVLNRNNPTDFPVCDRLFQCPEERTVAEHVAHRHMSARYFSCFFYNKGFCRIR